MEGDVKSTAVIEELLAAEPNGRSCARRTTSFPGERTSKFRLGRDDMLIGPNGESQISLEDYAVAMIDELENPKHTGHHFTVGY